MCRIAIRLGIAGYLLFAPAVAQQSGMVSGTVTDQNRKPVRHARVVAFRRFPVRPGPGTPAFVGSDTDDAGAYQFATLPIGSYLMCAQQPGQALLDPCLWSASPPIANLAPGRKVAVNIVLQTGTFLHLRVDDPGKAIKQFRKNESIAPYTFLLWTASGTPQMLKASASDATGENVRMVVPFEQSLRLSLQIADTLELDDDNGKKVDTSTAPIIIQAHLGDAEPTIRFNANAKK